MKAFFIKYSFLFIWVLALVIFGALSVLIFQLSAFTAPFAPAILPPPHAAPGPVVPPPPSATVTIVTSATGDQLLVQWENLPDGTTALEVFRAETGTQDWSLWKTISVLPTDLTAGQNESGISASDEAGYSFYLQAINDNGGGGGNGSNGSGTTPDEEEVLWTSSSTVPTVTTSTPSAPQGNGNGGTPPAAQQSPTSTSNASSSTGTATPPENPSSSNSQGNGDTPPPSGNPYYNPQVQIEAYGSSTSGNFWVQHVSQEIQMGWQDLPSSTTNIVISRSDAAAGPWTQIFAQGDVNPSQAYSIQIVDDTLGAPYYYELAAQTGSTTLATYGPEYLAPPGAQQ